MLHCKKHKRLVYMKKIRGISIVLVLSLLLPVFALSACTDDEDETRELNQVEQLIIGKWKTNVSDDFYTFYSDGTWTYTRNGVEEIPNKFRQLSDGVDGEYGHYYIIELDASVPRALFDAYPDRMAMMYDSNTRPMLPFNDANTIYRFN